MNMQPHPRYRRQDGQASMWFLAMIAACCCVFALVYNVGQVANQKEATINAADAAALSGATVEARMLNFEAYTNRAVIANEVTIAQIISLDSWINYDNQMVQTLNDYVGWVPLLGQAIASVAGATETATEVFSENVPVAVLAVEAINTGLLAAQTAASQTGAKAADDVAGQIAAANSTSLGAGMATIAPEVITFSNTLAQVNQANWDAFTFLYSGNGRADERSMVLNSLDDFTNKRDEGVIFNGADGVPGLNALMKAGNLLASDGFRYQQFEKTSGTTTLKGFDTWEAQDSIDLVDYEFGFYCKHGGLFGLHFLCWNAVPPVVGPMLAYGRADANPDETTGANTCYYQNPVAFNCRLATDDPSTPAKWQGLPSLRDLAKDLITKVPCSTNNGSDGPALPYVAAVQKSAVAAQTTQEMGEFNTDVDGPQGSPRLDDGMQDGQLTSLSAACVFFLRPDSNDKSRGDLGRADGKHEYASLYNPYWQARLSAPDPAYMQALYTFIGQPNLTAAMP